MTLCLLTLLIRLPVARATFDWQDGPWGIVIDSSGTPGAVSCPIDFPGGTNSGTALAIHYAMSPTDWPQLWVFLTDGFWRQTSAESEFLTSYRLLQYWSPTNAMRDRNDAISLSVIGTNETGELMIAGHYANDDGTQSIFRVRLEATLERPAAMQTALRARITVSNATGTAVAPYWQGHRLFAEQWALFGVSSMYVADHLTGGLPDWYDALDPTRQYVGLTNDASFLNDGYSVNGSINVSTHDAKYIVASPATVALAHDTNLCPIVLIPDHEWHKELVMLAQPAPELLVQHAYRSARNHRIELLECAGLTSTLTNLEWSATYKRDDTNMVDGDNIQIRLGLDGILDAWPADGVQTLILRASTGNTRPAITSLLAHASGVVSIGWTPEPGETYTLEHAPAPGAAWSNVANAAGGPALGPLVIPPGLLRVAEELP